MLVKPPILLFSLECFKVALKVYLTGSMYALSWPRDLEQTIKTLIRY